MSYIGFQSALLGMWASICVLDDEAGLLNQIRVRE